MKLKLKIMMCLPMKGYDNDTIRKNLMEIETFLTERYFLPNFKKTEKYDELEVLYTDNFVNYKNPIIADNDDEYRLFCLGNGLSNVMPYVDCVVFCPGWANSRGCVAEAFIAKLYRKECVMVNRDAETGKLYIASDEAFDDMLKLGIKMVMKDED